MDLMFICDQAEDQGCVGGECPHSIPHPVHSDDPVMVEQCDGVRVCGDESCQVSSKCVLYPVGLTNRL